jgi:hypothetical protein
MELPERLQRRIYEWIQVECLSFDEVASMLRVTESQVEAICERFAGISSQSQGWRSPEVLASEERILAPIATESPSPAELNSPIEPPTGVFARDAASLEELPLGFEKHGGANDHDQSTCAERPSVVRDGLWCESEILDPVRAGLFAARRKMADGVAGHVWRERAGPEAGG